MGASRRSFWGWGWEDRFPNAAGRKNLGAMVQATLGQRPSRLEEPVALDDVELPEPRVAPPEALAGVFTTDRYERAWRTHGRSYPDIVRGFEGDFQTAPDLVALPRTEADVVAILDWASDAGVAVVPFGGGTSVVAGVEPDADTAASYAGVVCVDMTRMGRVLEIDERSRAARIEAGALGPGLEAQLGERGLTLRHFPQSFEFSTLGGWLATRSGGHFATVYQHIDELAESLRVVTPAGTLESRRLPGSGAGPSPDRLVMGSEGALGIITEAWMRVRPRPTWRSSASLRFDAFEPAVEAARALAQSALYPSNCRVLDKREAGLHRVVSDGSHVLLVAFESADHPTAPLMELALELVADFGGRCPGGPVHRAQHDAGSGPEARAKDAEQWRRAFIDAPYLVNSMVSLGVVSDTFETACTWDRFEALHADVVHEVRAAMKAECGGGFISCRCTHVYPDGPAPYYTFVAPGAPDRLAAQWWAIKTAASEVLDRHGATITHHHAVGRTHRRWYDRQRPELFADALRAVKGAWDPDGVMNPGVLVDPARG